MFKNLIISVLCLFGFGLYAQEQDYIELYFEPTQSIVSEINKSKLHKFWKARSLDESHFIQLSGHTDSIGSLAYNRQLSAQRVNNVKKYLIEVFQLPAQLIKTSQFGETKPKYQAKDWGNNRRVELRIHMYPTDLVADTEPILGNGLVVNSRGCEQEIVDRDTVLEDGCTVVKIEAGTFAPYKNSEVKIDLVVIDDSNRDALGVKLLDEAGVALISGGMFSLKATVNGQLVKAQKPIQACVEAQNYPLEFASRMKPYEGIKDSIGQIVWRRLQGHCNRVNYEQVVYKKSTNQGHKDCDCYELTFSSQSTFINCDCPFECEASTTPNEILLPRLDDSVVYWSSDEKIAVVFLSEKPQNIEVLHTPSPDIKYKTKSKHFMHPPVFQNLDFHRDLLLKCDPKFYDKDKTVRLFLSRKLKNNQDKALAPRLSFVNASPNIVVYTGKMTKDSIIEWSDTIYSSRSYDAIHCSFLVIDLPFTGYYKIVDRSKMSTDTVVQLSRIAKGLDYSILKVRAPRNAEVLAAHKDNNYIYYKLDNYKLKKKKGRYRYKPKHFIINKVMAPEQTLIYVSTKRKKINFKTNQPISFASLKYKWRKGIYIIKRKRLFRWRGK